MARRTVSTTASVVYGTVIRRLRKFSQGQKNKEPKWRHKGSSLDTGYQKVW